MPYEQIDDESVAEKIEQIASILKSDRKAHVFCQRALIDLTNVQIRVDGQMNQETIDAINFTIQKGLKKQFKNTTSHYAANYVQSQTTSSEYQDYLKKLFS